MRSVVSALLISTSTAVAAGGQAPMEIVVNIAAGRLDVIRNGERVRSYPVSVGLPSFATPTGAASIRRMVWNPTWTPPDAAWARDEKPAAPGWGNPMGRVKMHLFEDYYIHGTPASNERRIGRPASHGCIRMRNRDVMELARLVLEADGAPVTTQTVEGLASNPRRTRELALQGRVRVRIEYRVAEVDRHALTLHPDVYGRAAGARYVERARADLRGAGVAPEAVGIPVGVSRAPGSALRISRMDIVREVRVPKLTAAPPTLAVVREEPAALALRTGL